ncbi:glycosyltransferase [Nocardioides piscis]|uniref:Glycosyl transferase family 28 C-terminal domain-containing protein n=1 Tax=Nocardioides piscis TaxID=2714938 RepID=A0A6G7YD94_9ACTN|nr:glycosyltransferase [Nocardioides piscis]QIK74608.1 hypothetical protein G7071_03340 [Nocardioides piscis]
MSPIGYYIHHHGSGHLHRALTLAPHLPGPVTGFSSLARPAGWEGPWVELPRDDSLASYADAHDVSVGDRLHWAPLGDPGLRERMSLLAGWIGREAPAAMVVDQSVEVCLLARLHGVPVVALTAPGRRTDPAHRLGFDAATALVGAWPPGATSWMLPGLDPAVAARFQPVGAVSRFPVTARPHPSRRRRHAVLIAGTGGDGFTAATIAAAQEQTPDWDWTILSRTLGSWHHDPSAVLTTADVAVLHPGQNSLAEVAALRLPAVVVPAQRPFDEQHVTAEVLRDEWPAVVADELETADWGHLLHQAADLDGDGWAAWCDGGAPARVAAVVSRVLDRARAA